MKFTAVKTDMPLDEVNAKMEAHAKEHTFGVLHSYLFQEILESKGFPIQRDVRVYEVCNPKGAQAMLTNVPQLSALLPCRISVYEEDGQTVISTIDLEELIGSLDVSDELCQSAKAIYQNLLNILNSFE